MTCSKPRPESGQLGASDGAEACFTPADGDWWKGAWRIGLWLEGVSAGAGWRIASHFSRIAEEERDASLTFRQLFSHCTLDYPEGLSEGREERERERAGRLPSFDPRSQPTGLLGYHRIEHRRRIALFRLAGHTAEV